MERENGVEWVLQFSGFFKLCDVMCCKSAIRQRCVWAAYKYIKRELSGRQQFQHGAEQSSMLSSLLRTSGKELSAWLSIRGLLTTWRDLEKCFSL